MKNSASKHDFLILFSRSKLPNKSETLLKVVDSVSCLSVLFIFWCDRKASDDV